MNILITICARGGSKGIPGKNIKLICGRPLISYTIAQTQRIKEKWNSKVALSTDDVEIKRVAEESGLCSNYIRPDYLATDSAGKIDVIRDLLLYEESLTNFKYDYILDLDVTSPLRTLEDIENSFAIINAKPEAQNLFSVNIAARNPYFNMVEENLDGYYSLSKTMQEYNIMTRQSAPKVYELNASFYWYRRSFFDSNFKSAITNKSLIFEMKHICFDLDHSVDFLFMEYLMQHNRLNFEI